jgi:hypothetical protein
VIPLRPVTAIPEERPMYWAASIVILIVLGFASFVLWFVFPQFLINWNRTGAIARNPKLVEFLTREECDRVFADVLSLRDLWKPFPNPLGVKPLYYLGAAKYIEEHSNYREHAGQMNVILEQKFRHVYDKLIGFFQRELGAPVRLWEGGAYPGFHIFVRHWMSRYPIASLHYDKINARPSTWGDRLIEGFFSFTLPIRLPSKGAGLFVFDETAADVPPHLKPLLKFREKTKVEYREGTLVIHDGLTYHMIAPSDIEDGEYRMTMQGHGLLIDGAWHLYF